MPEINLGDPILFYDGSVELRFDKDAHVYHRMNADGSSVVLEGVTTIANVLDHSVYLMPWATKMMYLKLLRTVPRVTAELDGAERLAPITWTEFDKIAQEAKSAHREHFEDAGDVGNMAHQWLEDSIKHAIAKNDGIVDRMHPNAPTDERAVNCGMEAFKWMQKHNVRWLRTERKIYSREFEYAGTMDGLALVDSCDDPACCHTFFMDQRSLIDWKSSNSLKVEFLYQTAAYVHAETEEFNIPIAARWIIRLGKEEGDFEAWYEKDQEQDFQTFLACLNLYRLNKAVDKRMRDLKKLKTFRKREAKKAAKPPKVKNARKNFKGADPESVG